MIHFLLAGYLFACVLVGVDPGVRRPPYPLRLVLLFATMAFHAFFGVALLTGEAVLRGRVLLRPSGGASTSSPTSGTAARWPGRSGRSPTLGLAHARRGAVVPLRRAGGAPRRPGRRPRPRRRPDAPTTRCCGRLAERDRDPAAPGPRDTPSPVSSEPLDGAGAATTGTPSAPTAPPDPFDLDGFVALPRVGGTGPVARTAPGSSSVPPRWTRRASAGQVRCGTWTRRAVRPARLLTRSTEGESGPRSPGRATLLFLSSRPDPVPATTTTTKRPAALWLLPAARWRAAAVWCGAPAASAPSASPATPGTLVLGSPPRCRPRPTSTADEAATKARKDAGVRRSCTTAYPVRFWDHDIGPAQHPPARAPSVARRRGARASRPT